VAYACEHTKISNTTLLDTFSLIFTIVFVFAGTAVRHCFTSDDDELTTYFKTSNFWLFIRLTIYALQGGIICETIPKIHMQAGWLQNACYEPRRDGLAPTALFVGFSLELTLITIYDLSLIAALVLLCN
jgi:hypothetical protein